MESYTEVNDAIVSPALASADPQRSLGQDGPETVTEARIFAKRLDIHDVITLVHPDGDDNPVSILCNELHFHTNGMLQSKSDMVVFAGKTSGFVAIQSTRGTKGADAEDISGIPPTVPGQGPQGATGVGGRNASFDTKLGIPYNVHSARPGSPGGTGGIGGTGQTGDVGRDGERGRDASDITFFSKEFHPDCILEISAPGGAGGAGGNGGTGGRGQKGGTGGTGGTGGAGNSLSSAKRGGGGGSSCEA